MISTVPAARRVPSDRSAACQVTMALVQVVASGDAGRGAEDRRCGRRLLLDFISEFPCSLSGVEVEAAVYDDECECQAAEGWLTAQEAWQFGDDLYELAMANVDKDQWSVAWRKDFITNRQVVEDLRHLYFPEPAMRVVWLEGVKGELADEAARHEESLLKRLNAPISGVIVLDDSDDEGEGSVHEADGGSAGACVAQTVRSSFSAAPGPFPLGFLHVPACAHRARRALRASCENPTSIRDRERKCGSILGSSRRSGW